MSPVEPDTPHVEVTLPRRRRPSWRAVIEDTPVGDALRRAIDRAEDARKQIPQVPPTVAFELRRKALHVFVAVVAVPLLLLAPFFLAIGVATVGIAVISTTWFIERRRLQSLMLEAYRELVHDPVAYALEKTRREHEDFPWSPVLYTLALILIGLAHHYLNLASALVFGSFAILGVGDAASALFGVAYGRTQLPWNPKKSLEGTIAGVTAGFLAGSVMSTVPLVFTATLVPPLLFAIIAAGAIAGALAETLPRVEDNFVVPLTSAAVMWGLAALIGLPLV